MKPLDQKRWWIFRTSIQREYFVYDNPHMLMIIFVIVHVWLLRFHPLKFNDIVVSNTRYRLSSISDSCILVSWSELKLGT